MMRYFFVSVCFLLLTTTISFGQTDEIGVVVHIIRTSNGQNGLSESHINTAIANVNNVFSQISMHFFVAAIRYNDNDTYASMSESQMSSLFNSYNVYQGGAINLYFTPSQSYKGSSGLPDGRADILGIPHVPPGIVVGNGYADSSTVVHEFGHFFGLFHTYETRAGIEDPAVPSWNTGDHIYDTAAEPDPGLTNGNNLLNWDDQCQYWGAAAYNGHQYQPDASNFMAAAPPHCRTHFTSNQLDLMHQMFLTGERAYLKGVNWTKFTNLIGTNNGGGTFVVGGVSFNSSEYYPFPTSAVNVQTGQERLQTNYKHYDWNSDISKFRLTLQNFQGSLLGPEQRANFSQMSSVTIKAALLDGGEGGSINFRDPWYVAADGSQPDALLPFGSPYSPTGAYNQQSGGVFLGQSVVSGRYYSASTSQTQTILGFTAYFQNWSTNGLASLTYPTNLETPVVFNTQGAVVTAVYKGHMATGAGALTDAKNQRRVISSGSTWAMVYESMGDIWISFSGDGGSTWSKEDKLNTIAGQASNPSISNVSGGSRAMVSWIENNNGTAELHLQTILLSAASGQAIWYGWNPSVSTRGSANHTTINAIPVGQGGWSFAWRSRLDARPVTFVSTDLSYVLFASGRNGSGIMTGTILGASDFTTAYIVSEQFGGGRTISTATSDKCPVFIYYPSAYGYPASTRVYYLAGGYASGLRIAQYNYLSGQTQLIPGAYGDYSYYSIQGGSDMTSARFALVTQAYTTSGTFNVNYYQHPTYYGNDAPTFARTFTNMKQPTIMVQNASGFGDPTYELEMLSTTNNQWYKNPGGTTLTSMGGNTAGIFAREQVGSGDRAFVSASTTTTPTSFKYYSGSGQLQKNVTLPVSVDVKAIRSWKAQDGSDSWAVFDFSGADVETVDTLDTGSVICAFKVINPSSAGLFVKQPDSLAMSTEVQLISGGKTLKSYLPRLWHSVGTNSIANVSPSDVIALLAPREVKLTMAYEEVALRDGTQSVDQQLTGDELVEREQSVAVYPNPFNPSTTFRLRLPASARISLRVYNLLGQVVTTLVDRELSAGDHQFTFDGSHLSSGMYFYRLILNDKVESGRIVLTK